MSNKELKLHKQALEFIARRKSDQSEIVRISKKAERFRRNTLNSWPADFNK